MLKRLGIFPIDIISRETHMYPKYDVNRGRDFMYTAK